MNNNKYSIRYKNGKVEEVSMDEFYKIALYSSLTPTFTFSSTTTNEDNSKDLIPVKIIFNDRTTICYFSDNTKVTSTCGENEEFNKEVGVMSCIMKKIFNSRSSFLRLVESGYVQPVKKV